MGTLAIAGTITLAIAGTAHADIPFSHAVNGHATYYNDAGYGACGTQINAASQRLLAVVTRRSVLWCNIKTRNLGRN